MPNGSTKTPPRSRAARQRRMQRIVADLQRYAATYSDQQSFADYSDETFINDMLYGIGVALDREKYSFASGFVAFQEDLRRHLTPAKAPARAA